MGSREEGVKSAPGTKGWDVDLGHGQAGEDQILGIVNGKVEVKRDRMAHFSGRVVVEYEYNGRPSGIATTEAVWWAFCIDDSDGNLVSVFMVPTRRLKAMARMAYKAGMVTCGGDRGQSKMVFIPLTVLYGQERSL
jgi:hypothetical protein